MSLIYLANLAVNGLEQGFVIALAALAINLVFAVARFPNAATGDYMTVSAYAGIGAHAAGVSSIIGQGVVAVLAGMAVSLLFYLSVFRKLFARSMVGSLVASIGVAFFARSMLTFFVGHQQYIFKTPITRALNFGGLRINPIDLWLSATALAALAMVFVILFGTPLGRRMRAVADNLELARASGIRAARVMIALWLLVGAVCGVAGMVLGIQTVVRPDMGWDILLPAFAAAILGGVGSPTGAVLAGAVLGVAESLSTPLVGFTYKVALPFVVLMAVLVIRPQGLFGALEKVR